MLINVEIQTSKLYIFVVLSHLFHEVIVVVDHWSQNLNLGFCNVFLKRFHIEIVEVGKVII